MEAVAVIDVEHTTEEQTGHVIPLSLFVREFGQGLLEAVGRDNPPVYNDDPEPSRDEVMDLLTRKPFKEQGHVVQAVTRLMIDADEDAAIINAEMGTGKTMMAICAAAVMHSEGYRRSLVISPPHLVYKWRREILETVPGARVWVLNGADTLSKLLQLRSDLRLDAQPSGPEFFVLGRVRMRMGFHWRPAIAVRTIGVRHYVDSFNQSSCSRLHVIRAAACPRCGAIVRNEEGEPVMEKAALVEDKRLRCASCGDPLWTLMRSREQKKRGELVLDALKQLPTIGPKTAARLINTFGEDHLAEMLADNVYEFINLMDNQGELVFSDRQAARLERSLATAEFALGQGGYQPTEFIKRYLPQGYFGLLIVDEGHEYKNEGSAQGQAMAVLASKAQKVLLLTGTLMGGYADDLFFLLWRILSRRMIADGYRYNARGSLGSAAMGFMRDHGILQDVYKECVSGSHKTANGKKIGVRTVKKPGFGPKGIVQYVLPYTAFLKLKQIEGNVLPPYREHFVEVDMTKEQADHYRNLSIALKEELKQALRTRDTSLLGVVLNVLLAWPDTCFRPETVKHPRSRQLLAFVPKVFEAQEPAPKEQECIDICRRERFAGRRVLVYTTYTGKRDTTVRFKTILEAEGFRVAVLRSSIDTSKREEWIMDQVDRGIDVLITNPELVKTGLDLLEFPTIVFLQTGYNAYTLQQASRRSWRIGQRLPIDVYFLGYQDSAQITCLSLMAKKIAVSQSTSGDMPDTGLDVLNQDGDSVEVALAKQLLH